jgi:hypothetical protein
MQVLKNNSFSSKRPPKPVFGIVKATKKKDHEFIPTLLDTLINSEEIDYDQFRANDLSKKFDPTQLKSIDEQFPNMRAIFMPVAESTGHRKALRALHSVSQEQWDPSVAKKAKEAQSAMQIYDTLSAQITTRFDAASADDDYRAELNGSEECM